MALLFWDGFDKFGGPNTNSTAVIALLTAGEWTTATGAPNIVAPLSATGFALSLNNLSAATKTLGANYGRLIGGVRFSSNLLAVGGIQFYDGGTQQAGICINTAGTIAVRNGFYNSGTVLGTSSTSVSANTNHYLEWDITFANAGSYQLWLDGVSILGPTAGDTTATANAFANGVGFSATSTAIVTIDDFYLLDTAGTTNNAPLLTSPRIETQFPTGDGAVQFAIGASTLGNSVSRNGGNTLIGANTIYVRPYTPSRACAINSISLLPNSTNGSINLRPVLYADNAGTPTGAALLSAGSTVTGITSGTVLIMPLTTPQSLTAGTQYWLGWMADASAPNFNTQDGTAQGRTAPATFSSGAPGTGPTFAAGAATITVYGNITLASPVNYYEVASQPPQGSNSYVYDATVGHEDLYTYPALSAPPSAIYAVAVKANISKSDAGARTVSVRLKSGATDSAGTGGTALAPATSYGWMTSLYERDPNGNIAWTKTALDAAQAGLKVET